MGKFIDLTNQRFGKLTVLYKDIKRTSELHKVCWICKCDCGNIKSIIGYTLRDKEHPTVSCGCFGIKQRAEATSKARLKDLTHKRFGKLLVIERYNYEKYGKSPSWLCKCDCGNTCVKASSNLLSGKTKSCGCLTKESPSNYIDLTGEKFGLLTVIERSNFYLESNKYVPYWVCKCDCGNIRTINGDSLKSGKTISCGCSLQSSGELIIKEILDNHNITYLYNSTYFNDLKYKLPLRYDFIIFDEGIPTRIIEFDGKQHYEDVAYFRNTLTDVKIRDNIKNKYAIERNIPLIRIPYTDKKIITYEDLFTDKYLIKESNKDE